MKNPGILGDKYYAGQLYPGGKYPYSTSTDCTRTSSCMSVNASVDVRDSETDQGDRCVTGYIIVNDIII